MRHVTEKLTSYPFKPLVIFVDSWEIKLELKEEDYSRAQIDPVKFIAFLFMCTQETWRSLVCWQGREITEKRAARAELLFCLLAAVLLFWRYCSRRPLSS